MRKLIPIALVFILAVFAYAGNSVDTYQYTNASEYRSGITATDVAATVIANVEVKGAPTVEVSGRSSVASATMVIVFRRLNTDGTVRSSSEITLTAGDDANTDVDENGDYISNTAYFDTGSGVEIEVACQAPSAGTWALWATPVGPSQR